MLWLKLKIDGGITLHFRVRGYKTFDKAKPDESSPNLCVNCLQI